MRKTGLNLIILAVLVLNTGSLFPSQTQDQVVIKRFIMAVGANSGGKDRAQLRYAISDAEAILQVFQDLGGVSDEDTLFLEEPNVRTFYTELAKFQSTVKKAKSEYSRVEFIFYYSGHSDEEHILLGKEKIAYKDLRETIADMDVDVRIAILDSCASGAFTRIKGGKKRQPFLLDSAYDMRGYAVLTSSSSSEASQESDLIRASFFTHYLISGMRGAADMSQDGRVTLNEAYQFAFNETLAQTTKTVSGPQHPHNHIVMSGTGDVVMTDIRKSSVVLVLGEDIHGRIFIHDAKDRLVVELTKAAGRTIELGLEEGEYRVINIPNGDVFESKIKLIDKEDFVLTPAEFTETDLEYTTPRGDREQRVQKQTVLQGKSKYALFVELNSKSTSMYGEYGLLSGLHIGVTINRVFSVGVGGYGKVNFTPGLPAYGCITFAYAFSPDKKFHFRATALAGAGNSPLGDIFYIFEPGAEVILNISRIVRFQVGLSIPLVDKSYTGLDSVILNVGFQFGK
jgi:hypothetical protein